MVKLARLTCDPCLLASSRALHLGAVLDPAPARWSAGTAAARWRSTTVCSCRSTHTDLLLSCSIGTTRPKNGCSTEADEGEGRQQCREFGGAVQKRTQMLPPQQEPAVARRPVLSQVATLLSPSPSPPRDGAPCPPDTTNRPMSKQSLAYILN